MNWIQNAFCQGRSRLPASVQCQLQVSQLRAVHLRGERKPTQPVRRGDTSQWGWDRKHHNPGLPDNVGIQPPQFRFSRVQGWPLTSHFPCLRVHQSSFVFGYWEIKTGLSDLCPRAADPCPGKGREGLCISWRYNSHSGCTAGLDVICCSFKIFIWEVNRDAKMQRIDQTWVIISSCLCSFYVFGCQELTTIFLINSQLLSPSPSSSPTSSSLFLYCAF